MSSNSIAELLKGKIAEDTQVTAQGWVRSRRDSKAGVSFINLHDGSCFNPIQVVVPQTLENYQTEISRVTAGCSLTVTGKLVASQGKGQSFEIQAESVQVVGWVADPDTYPIQPKPHTLEYLREVAHLRPRTNTIGAVSRIRHSLAQALHRFFHENGFFWLPTPTITTSDCEGAGEMFRVSTLDLANLPKTPEGKIDFSQDFFGKETFLTVSGQLNAESYCLAMSKVYTFGPTFRAENSNTTRHLAEFWMLEPEVAFADLQMNADLAQAMLKYVFKAALTECADDMAFFAERYQADCIERLAAIVQADFVRMEYTDAIKILENSGKKFEYPVAWGEDLKTEHERFIAEEYVKAPVILMNYPKKIKPFYMRINDDNNTVAAMDVLVPGVGEIIGGSQREERLEILEQRMDDWLLPKDHYQWYLDLRRYGTVPHAGFGLGFERLLSYVTGLANVRDINPFPRTPKHAEF